MVIWKHLLRALCDRHAGGLWRDDLEGWDSLPWPVEERHPEREGDSDLPRWVQEERHLLKQRASLRIRKRDTSQGDITEND